MDYIPHIIFGLALFMLVIVVPLIAMVSDKDDDITRG